MNVYELSDYQLYQLKSIDPALSTNWKAILIDILPKLNPKGQKSLYQNILKPRGIRVTADKKMVYQRPSSLSQTLKHIQIENDALKPIIHKMLAIVSTIPDHYDSLQLADEIEVIFAHLDALDTHNVIHQQRNLKKVRTAFLYDLAYWVDNVKFDIRPGLRNLDASIVKAYLKEVFIKQKLQGRDFRKWSSSDVSFQEFDYLPQFIRDEGKRRKFIVVEASNYWFLIGSSDDPNKNPYSFRRFLHEEHSGDKSNSFIYLTHAVMNKQHINNPKYLSYTSYIMSRFFTLDSEPTDTLLSFVSEIQELNKRYLKPLLKKRIEQGTYSIERTIKERLINYEKQTSILILAKLPRMIQSTLHNEADQNYLFYNVDQLIKQMTDDVQDFRLQPLASDSPSSELLSLKLVSIRKLLSKSRSILCNADLSQKERTSTMTTPLRIIQTELDEVDESIQTLLEMKDTVKEHQEIRENGSFWDRIKLGKKPRYGLEDIEQTKIALQESVFTSIVRLAKDKNEGMVYLEFECDEVMNEHYRHYALAKGDLGISRLPKILRLPENRRAFDIASVKKVINQDIFEIYQAWDS